MEQAAALPALGPQLAAGQPPDAAAGQRDQRADARRVEGGRHAVGEKLPAGADRTPGRGRQRPKAEQVEQAAHGRAELVRRVEPEERRPGGQKQPQQPPPPLVGEAFDQRAAVGQRRLQPLRIDRGDKLASERQCDAAPRYPCRRKAHEQEVPVAAGPQLERGRDHPLPERRPVELDPQPRAARRGAGIVEDDGRDLVGQRHDAPLGQRACPRRMERNNNCGGSGRLDTRLHESAPSEKGGASIGWRRRPAPAAPAFVQFQASEMNRDGSAMMSS